MKNEKVTVRELRAGDDLASVLSLCRDFFTEYRKHHAEFFDTRELADDQISGRFLQSIESDRSATITAHLGDQLVGYTLVTLKEQPGFYRFKTVGAISGLMVDRRHRRKGIGSLLVSEAKAFFRRHGVKYFMLYTAAANEGALEFYRRLGLEPLQITMIGETGGHDLS